MTLLMAARRRILSIFIHYDLNFLALYLDSNQISSKPYTPDFDNDTEIRSYISLFTGTGQTNTDERNHISRKEYGEGYTLFAFNLSPDSHLTDDFQLIKQGSLRLEMRFKNALSTTINVVQYSEFDNIIKVDKARNILHDYSSWIVWKLITYWEMTLLGNRYFVVSLRWICKTRAYVCNTAPQSHPGTEGFFRIRGKRRIVEIITRLE